MAKKPTSTERHVLVTTAHRGVFAGYAAETGGDRIMLRAGRCCIQWRGLKGFLDLAVTGPTRDCRIGPAADIELRAVTSVTAVQPAATAAWEAAPWRR